MDVTAGETPATDDSDAVVLARARGLVEYLLAVRALLERPARAVPLVDAFWEHDLPDHPAVRVGPDGAAEPWLRVGRPRPPDKPLVPPDLADVLVWDLSYDNVPQLVASDVSEETPPAGAWIEDVWRPWAATAAAADATRKLHDRLYDLRFRLDNDTARAELVWGHMVLDAHVAGHHIWYPLVVTPVAIEYDPDTTTVSVVPQGPARVQPDALADIDARRVADLLDLAGTGNQIDVDPWDDVERRDFADRAMRRLGFDPILRPPADTMPTSAGPHVVDTGVLFMRPRQRMVRRFLEQMRDRLESGTGEVGALASVLAHGPSRLHLAEDDDQAWAGVADRLLMPMATNEAQESIVRRLAEHRSVAVQGPPGTGKTHTIRNLICHLVAHGKRVLVLAQKEDPLRVLRGGLPAEIQPLCLSILGRSADQLVQLQTAARELSDRAATLDQAVEARWVDHLDAEIAQVEAHMAATREQLRSVAEREGRVYPDADTGAATASDIGAWLRRNAAAIGFIPDPVEPGVDAPLTSAAFGELFDIARRTSAADRVAALTELPPEGVLPTGEEIGARRRSLHDATKVVDALLDRGIDVDGVRRLGEDHLAELSRTLRAATDELTRREGTWADRLGRLVRDPSWQPVWDDHVAGCHRLLTGLGQRTTLLAGRAVSIPGDRAGEPRRLLAQLAQARARIAADRKISRLTQPELARLVTECTVDGEALRTAADVDLVIATIERRQLRAQLTLRWTEWSTRLDFPIPAGAEPEVWAGRLLTDAVETLDWDRHRWPALYRVLVDIHPRCARDADVRTLAELAGAVEACGNVLLEDRVTAENRTIETAIGGRTDLTTAWHSDNDEAWDIALAEIARLRTIAADAHTFEHHTAVLRESAPQWTALIDRGEAVPATGDIATAAWAWRQAQTWFDDTVGTLDTAELGRDVERAGARVRMLTRDMLIASAWLQVARTLDDGKKAALADWTAALRKVGKGTGKSAGHWQAVAQRAMVDAVAAVPVWIMSIDRALEQFHGGEPIFDVVIVDEASQADIFALPVLSLARRAVVVGDDQQIGPQIVGVPTERVRGLIDAHLGAVPSAEHFDTDGSLYDHAVRRSPQRILLTEHFRSVPAIIAFSSNHYYDRKIQPLRADTPGDLGAAVNSVYVAGGSRKQHPTFGDINVAEAEALVSRVAAIVADDAYTGRTLGVVSLLSTSGQADYLQHRLRAEIGVRELEHRALRVGDAYTFQGDERDVVLISMVAAGNNIGAFTKRDYHRRINVAASRARDQLWLFHSVQAADLAADDARALLLAHCQSTMTIPTTREGIADPRDACTNDFERDVLTHLLRRGLAPTAQFRIGDHRIDFVLHAPDGRRLAIECDSDRYLGPDAWTSELRRQSTIERVGNATFIRLRASVFHREPEVALAPLWQRATDMSIL
jgi:REase_MTES_1575/AAA domain